MLSLTGFAPAPLISRMLVCTNPTGDIFCGMLGPVAHITGRQWVGLTLSANTCFQWMKSLLPFLTWLINTHASSVRPSDLSLLSQRGYHSQIYVQKHSYNPRHIISPKDVPHMKPSRFSNWTRLTTESFFSHIDGWHELLEEVQLRGIVSPCPQSRWPILHRKYQWLLWNFDQVMWNLRLTIPSMGL